MAERTKAEERAFAQGIAWTLGVVSALRCSGATMQDAFNEIAGNGYPLNKLATLGADDFACDLLATD